MMFMKSAALSRPKKIKATPGFRVIAHPSDVGLEAWGRNLAEALEQAAGGLFSLMTDLKAVRVAETKKIETAGADSQELVVNWLNELIFLFDTQHWIPKKFSVKISPAGKSLKSELGGEKIDPARHHFFIEIKAATYNKLMVKNLKNSAKIQVVFDV